MLGKGGVSVRANMTRKERGKMEECRLLASRDWPCRLPSCDGQAVRKSSHRLILVEKVWPRHLHTTPYASPPQFNRQLLLSSNPSARMLHIFSATHTHSLAIFFPLSSPNLPVNHL